MELWEEIKFLHISDPPSSYPHLYDPIKCHILYNHLTVHVCLQYIYEADIPGLSNALLSRCPENKTKMSLQQSNPKQIKQPYPRGTRCFTDVAELTLSLAQFCTVCSLGLAYLLHYLKSEYEHNAKMLQPRTCICSGKAPLSTWQFGRE